MICKTVGELAKALDVTPRQIFRWKKLANFPNPGPEGYDLEAVKAWCAIKENGGAAAARKPIPATQAEIDAEDKRLRVVVAAGIAKDDMEQDGCDTEELEIVPGDTCTPDELRGAQKRKIDAQTAVINRDNYPVTEVNKAMGSCIFQLKIGLIKLAPRLSQLLQGKTVPAGTEIAKAEFHALLSNISKMPWQTGDGE